MKQIASDDNKYLISRGIDGFFIEVNNLFKFVIQIFKEAFTPPYEFQEVIKQCYQLGYKSLLLITAQGSLIRNGFYGAVHDLLWPVLVLPHGFLLLPEWQSLRHLLL